MLYLSFVLFRATLSSDQESWLQNYQHNFVVAGKNQGSFLEHDLLLKKEASKQRKLMKKISNHMKVNYDCMQSLSL